MVTIVCVITNHMNQSMYVNVNSVNANNSMIHTHSVSLEYQL